MVNVDFLLINLPPWAQENPHIGIGYLCAYIRNKGFRPAVLDLNKRFFLNKPDFKMLWHVENKNFWSNEATLPLILKIFKEDINSAVKEINNYGCDILGFSVVDPKERLTIEFIKIIKEKFPNKKIILGGPATSTYEQRKIFLDNIANYIDLFVVGEGEETLLEIMKKVANNEELKNIQGAYWKENDVWHYLFREPINPIEQLAIPTYEEFDLNLYGKSLLVEWSRGCWGKCAFCKNYTLFAGYRSKHADWVINELLFHKQQYGIEEYTVVDNILNGNLINLANICKKIIENNLKIRWSGQIAPRKDMDKSFFKLLKKAGCIKLQIGLESGSNKVLQKMKKSFTAEISEKNIRYAKEAGIETEIFVIIGFPGEQEIDFRQTCNFIKRNAKYINTIKSINTLHLIAGTEVYKNREQYNIKALPINNWHYLWETYDGNNYQVRKKRAEKLLDLASCLGIKVMETNIAEGKEGVLNSVIEAENLPQRIELLRTSIDQICQLPVSKHKKKKRNISRWIILIFLFFYVFFYIIYFWIYSLTRKRILWGGKKE